MKKLTKQQGICKQPKQTEEKHARIANSVGTHEPWRCPKYGNSCSKCGKLSHYE